MHAHKNISLDTERLYLLPLTADQLILYKNFDPSLELQLGILPVDRTLSDEVLSMLCHSSLPYVIIHPQFALFGTLWIIVLKSENVIVGDIGFKGAPSDKGLIEVGYSTYPDHMNKGYMTEALAAISTWAFQQPGVDLILAETDKTNLASQRILTKNNFAICAETEPAYWWRLDRIAGDS